MILHTALIILAAIAIDGSAWGQSCLAAGYMFDKDEWMEPFPIAWKPNKLVRRYIPLVAGAVAFSASLQHPEPTSTYAMWAAVLLFVVYFAVAYRMFYRDLKAYWTARWDLLSNVRFRPIADIGGVRHSGSHGESN